MAYAFEEYLLDPVRRELRRSGKVIAIEPQVFDVLECLVRNHRRIVSRDDLIAEVWDGRIVSDSTVSSRISAARRAIGDTGRTEHLIKTICRRGFRFVGTLVEPQQPVETNHPSTVSIPTTPSIAVLPFASLSDDGGEDELVYGIVEDITTALSQFRWLSVIARSQGCNYRGWAVDVRKVGRELLVHYIVEGSVRRSEGRVRVTSRLVDATTGTQIWARHFDLESTAMRLQDEVVASIVGALGSELEQIEIGRVKRCPLDSLNPAQRYLRGLGHVFQWNREGIDSALRMFNEAIAVDPEFAPAYGMAAYCYVQRKSYGWIVDRPGESAECERFARSAAQLASGDGFTLSKAAHAISSVVGDLDTGAILIERALKINPRLTAAWYVSAWINLFLGRPKRALDDVRHAIRLNPLDPLIFKMRAALAYAYLLEGRYDEATNQALIALGTRPGYLTAIRGAAASQALAGHRDDARRLICIMRERDSSLRVSNLSGLIPFQRQQDLARWADGLQKAGLPE